MISTICIAVSVITISSLFWQPSMGDRISRPIKLKDNKYNYTNIHWLRNLRIDIPEDLTDLIGRYDGVRLGYSDYGDIHLRLIRNKGSGWKHLGAIPYSASSSKEYANECRRIAGDTQLLTEYIVEGLEKRLD